MKEAFEVMSSHPLLTIFLEFVLIVSLGMVTDMIVKLFRKK